MSYYMYVIKLKYIINNHWINTVGNIVKNATGDITADQFHRFKVTTLELKYSTLHFEYFKTLQFYTYPCHIGNQDVKLQNLCHNLEC
jgi:hypothetical protein